MYNKNKKGREKKEKNMKHFNAFIENLKKVKKDWEEKEIEPTNNEKLPEPLSIDITHNVGILLSWGGPNSGIEFTLNSSGEIVKAIYWYKWGEEKEEVELTDEEIELVSKIYFGGEEELKIFLAEELEKVEKL